MTEAEIAKIAGGLSDKQRIALASASEEWRYQRQIGSHGSTLRSLCWFWPKGADPISPCVCMLSRDIHTDPLRYTYRLTPLGLSVCAHLLSEQTP